jgi:hypothetical protein
MMSSRRLLQLFNSTLISADKLLKQAALNSDQRWGQAYPASQRMRQIISRHSHDAANQAYPTCRSILLENPSPSLKSSKIACLFNSFAAFIHSSIKRQIISFSENRLCVGQPSIIQASNFQKRIIKLEKYISYGMHASCVWGTAIAFFGLASFLGLKNGWSIKKEWMKLKRGHFFIIS